MNNYRIYATEDNDLEIRYTLDGHTMGESLEKEDVTLDGTINGLPTTVKAGNELNFTVSATDIVTNDASSLYNQTADANIQKVVTATIPSVATTVKTNEQARAVVI